MVKTISRLNIQKKRRKMLNLRMVKLTIVD